MDFDNSIYDIHSLHCRVKAEVLYLNKDPILCQFQCSVPFPVSPLEDAVVKQLKLTTNCYN